MESLHPLVVFERVETRTLLCDREKTDRIRKKIRLVFGKDSTMDAESLSERYDITPDGDLILILR